MEQLIHTIEAYKEQAVLIKKEYPNVANIRYEITDVQIDLLKRFAFENKAEFKIGYDNRAFVLIASGTFSLFLYSKVLIISEPILTEE